MFSGIVEAKSVCTDAQMGAGVLQLKLKKPSDFNDLNLGDSICVNGVCLTLEEQSFDSMIFSLAAETLQVTGWSAENLPGKEFNVERSLRLGDRIHGHLVTGHVDEMAIVKDQSWIGESRLLQFSFSPRLKKYIWPKGSVAINGVSLTINKVGGDFFEVCLIPETLKRTNLGNLHRGQKISLEVDNFARGIVRQLEESKSEAFLEV